MWQQSEEAAYRAALAAKAAAQTAYEAQVASYLAALQTNPSSIVVVTNQAAYDDAVKQLLELQLRSGNSYT